MSRARHSIPLASGEFSRRPKVRNGELLARGDVRISKDRFRVAVVVLVLELLRLLALLLLQLAALCARQLLLGLRRGGAVISLFLRGLFLFLFLLFVAVLFDVFVASGPAAERCERAGGARVRSLPFVAGYRGAVLVELEVLATQRQARSAIRAERERSTAAGPNLKLRTVGSDRQREIGGCDGCERTCVHLPA